MVLLRIDKLLVLPLFLFALSLSAQPPGSTAADLFSKKLDALETARKFNFPDHYAKKLEYVYDFQLKESSGADQLIINETVYISLVSAKNKTVYNQTIFYDDQSSIEDVVLRNELNKAIQPKITYGNYQSENVFYDDVKIGTFDVYFPEAGLEKKIEYRKTYHDYKFLPKIYFPAQFPSVLTEIKVNVPAWLNIELVRFNFDNNRIEEKTEKRLSIDGELEYTTHTFSAHDVNAYKREVNSPSVESIQPHFFILFKSFTKENKEHQLMKDMRELYSWCSSLCGRNENDTSMLANTVKDITAGKKTDEEKILSIYNWVQEKIRYVAIEEGLKGYQPEIADKVFTNMYGDCKGMSNLLKQMLQAAGYDARLCWIGTRDIPYPDLYPIPGTFNHMICSVTLNGKTYFLDGTEDHIELGEIPYRLQGKKVVIEDGENFIIDTVPSAGYKSNLQESFTQLKITGNRLTGYKKINFNGEEKLNFASGYADIKTDIKEQSLKEYLGGNNKNIKISDIEISDLTEKKAPLRLNYNFSVDNHIYESGDELFVFLDFEKDYSNYIIDSLRVQDWELNHCIYIKSKEELEIPDGYSLQSQPGNFTYENSDYSIAIKTTEKGNKIEYTSEFIFKTGVIRKKDFKNWNAISTKLGEIYNTPLILKRINDK